MIDVAVIGAGWAGLAAAVGLVEAGRRVVVLEAAPRCGGRARAQSLTIGGHTVEVDNGQHLLIGAYRSTLALLGRLGVAPDAVLERRRLALTASNGFSLRAAALPAPLNLAVGLLGARGLPWSERLALIRAMHTLARRGPHAAAEDLTVAAWLRDLGQPPALIARLWEPLCVGALNTAIDQACARTFATVVCDALLGRAEDSDFLLPRSTLGAVLPEPASAWLEARGQSPRLRTPVRSLARTASGCWRIATDLGELETRQVVVAVPAHGVSRLLAHSIPATRLAVFDAFEHEPIATVWLTWRQRIALPPVTMLIEHPERSAFGQWLFARTAPGGDGPSTLAGVVVSVAGRRSDRPAALERGIAEQVASQLGVPLPDAARAIVERRATLRCAPTRPRLQPDALADVAPGLALAGDWCWPRYPATLESAVRSGDAAAAWLLSGRLPHS